MFHIDVDKWQEIYTSLKQYKLRTALTAFGVFWGIFMLVILIGAGKGLENGVLHGFGGTKNAVWIWSARKTSLPYAGLSKGRTITFKEGDIEAIRQNVTGLGFIMPGNYLGDHQVKHSTRSDSYNIVGVAPRTIDVFSLNVDAGRFINNKDLTDRRKVAVIGSRVKDILFPHENPIGKKIEIMGIFFHVVGVISPKIERTGGMGRSPKERVYLANSTMRYTFNQVDNIHDFIAVPKAGVDAATVEQAIDKLLRERHKIHPDDPGVVTTYNNNQEYKKYQGLFVGVRIFSWVVAVGTIIAGAIGVGNIMLIVVKERTKEIGIRKALGARPSTIVSMIVQESLVITGISGYLGLVTGVYTIELIDALFGQDSNGESFFRHPEVDFTTATIALSVLILAGVLAALMPAAKAARIDPVQALQDK